MNLTAALTVNKVLVLAGPTASGKTELALCLARSWGGEIVSADSRQIYRGMDIGTAKPSTEEQAGVRHHFIDICEPDQDYSAGTYGREARACIARLQAAGRPPIVAGGSGFYIRALLDGLPAPHASDPQVKAWWRQQIVELGAEAIHARLAQVDPASAARLHPNDTQRIVRALEVYQLSGQPLSAYKPGSEKPADFTPVIIGLAWPREMLYERIDRRVDVMIGQGLIEEVERLRDKGYGLHLNALRTVGYQEVFAHLQGELSREEMIALIKQHSRQYAKRQMTWFRRDARVQWMNVEEMGKEEMAKRITSMILE